MRSKLPFLTLSAPLAALLLLGAGPEFRGCGGADVPPDGGAIPIGDVECRTDEDCAVEMCMDFQCVAGACVLVASTIDRDIDGRSPPPCGDDCDDADPSVFPGAPEQCDGIDNDCNGMIDDGAPSLDRTIPLAVGEATSGIVRWGGGFLITILTRVAMLAVPVSVAGRTGATFEVMRLVSGTRFVAQRVVAADDDHVLFATLTDTGTLRYTVLMRGADGSPIALEPPTERTTSGPAVALDVIAFEGDWALAVEVPDASGTGATERDVFVTHDAADPAIRLPVAPPTGAPNALTLATDGANLVLDDGGDMVHFFSPDGSELGAYAAVGLSLLRHGLASGTGAVVIGTSDMFDFRLAHMDAMGTIDDDVPAPGSTAGGTLDLVSLSRGVAVARLGGFANVQILEDDLSTLGPMFRLESAVGDGIERVTASENGTTTAVLGAALSGTTLGISGACGS